MGALVLPAKVLGKVAEVGVRVSEPTPGRPLPLNVAVCVEPGMPLELSVTVSEPV